MAGRGVWTRAERRRFLDEFITNGDPGAAAIAAGYTLTEAFRLRERDKAFAADWDWAIALAWDRVRLRVLAALLGQAGGGAPIDPRIVLAVLRGGGPEVADRAPDPNEIRRLRAEVAAE